MGQLGGDIPGATHSTTSMGCWPFPPPSRVGSGGWEDLREEGSVSWHAVLWGDVGRRTPAEDIQSSAWPYSPALMAAVLQGLTRMTYGGTYGMTYT